MLNGMLNGMIANIPKNKQKMLKIDKNMHN
jgi:hypothetical protein